MIGDAERGEEQPPVARQQQPAPLGQPLERRLEQIFEHRPLEPISAEQQHGESRIDDRRSEEHTSELQSLMRISYAVFCLKTINSMGDKQRYLASRHDET